VPVNLHTGRKGALAVNVTAAFRKQWRRDGNVTDRPGGSVADRLDFVAATVEHREPLVATPFQQLQ
jgi:hypothetical protein